MFPKITRRLAPFLAVFLVVSFWGLHTSQTWTISSPRAKGLKYIPPSPLLAEEHITPAATRTAITTIPDYQESLETLKLVSFNMVGGVPSKEAPPEWTYQDSITAIQTELLRTDPDIIAVQEWPVLRSSSDGIPINATELFPNYTILDAAESSSAHHEKLSLVMLLVRRGIETEQVKVPISGTGIVVARLKYYDRQQTRELLVASVQLEPFQEGGGPSISMMRRQQIVLDHLIADAGSTPLIIAGDMNSLRTRDATTSSSTVDEDDSSNNSESEQQDTIDDKAVTTMTSTTILEDHWHLTDFWKQAGEDSDTKWTYDTRDHGSWCNRYNGNDPPRSHYAARYDRIFYHAGGSTINSEEVHPANGVVQQKQQPTATTNFTVLSFQLIANQPVTNKYHFLSDHFGISTSFHLDWSSS